MSTKIWIAYHLKTPKDLWSITHDIRIKGIAAIQKVLTKAYLRFSANITPETIGYQRNLKLYADDPEYADFLARVSTARQILDRGFRMASTRSERSLFDFEASVGFRSYKGEVYLIPYPGTMVRDCLNFLGRDPRLEDFHYQNQTDKPKNITNQAWEKRREVWDAMDDADLWKDVLVLTLNDWASWYLVDPWLDLVKGKKKYKKQYEKIRDEKSSQTE